MAAPVTSPHSSISSARPPVAAMKPGEHPSWFLPELPPVSSLPPTPPRAKSDRHQAAPPVLVWLRQEMRLEDNPCLSEAAATGRAVIPVFIVPADDEEGGWPLMGAARYWLHHALNHLQHALTTLGSALVLRDARITGSGGTLQELRRLLHESGATDVYMCEAYEPWRRHRDLQIAAELEAAGVRVHESRGAALYAPWHATPDLKGAHLGFGSVGFFLNGCRDCPEPPPPLPPPHRLAPPTRWPDALPLWALGLARMPVRRDGTVVDWASGIRQFWAAGEASALEALDGFVSGAISSFEGKQRHRADQRNTAVISPYLRFGELSPRTVVHRVQLALGARAPPTFLRRLAWRDLAYWALWRFPSLPDTSFRPHYEQQWWDSDHRKFEAWCAARTGYPLVDAAMTQLWQTGWIPNYMRHVVASFLVEYLNIDWRKGERWFAETLVDADTAINAYMCAPPVHTGAGPSQLQRRNASAQRVRLAACRLMAGVSSLAGGKMVATRVWINGTL